MKTYSFSSLYAVVFVGFLGYSMTLPIFTVMILEPNNVFFPCMADTSRNVLLGIVLFMYPFGQFLGSPIIGALSDRYGRKNVLLVSLAFSAIWYFFIALSLYMHSMAGLLITLFCAGFCEGHIAITQSAIADVVQTEQRVVKFGYVTFWSSFAYVIGPLFGAQLADSELVPWFSNATPFWAMILVLLMAMLWVALSFRETLAKELRISVHLSRAFVNLATVVTNKRLRFFYLRNLILYLSIFGYFRAFPMFMVDRFSVDMTLLSWLIAYVSVPIMLVNGFLIKYIARRFSYAYLCVTSSILMGIAMMVIVIPNHIHGFWFTLFPATFFLAITFPACSMLISCIAKKNEQGSVMGNNQALEVGAEAVASVVAGFIATVSIYAPLPIFGLIGVIAGVSFLGVSKRIPADN